MKKPSKKPIRKGTNNLPAKGNPKGVVVSQEDIQNFLTTHSESRANFSLTQWQAIPFALNQRCLTRARSVGKKDSRVLRDFVCSAGVAYDKAYPQAANEGNKEKVLNSLAWLFSKGDMGSKMAKGLGLVLDVLPKAQVTDQGPRIPYKPVLEGLRLGTRPQESAIEKRGIRKRKRVSG